jgi:hypothetical protein
VPKNAFGATHLGLIAEDLPAVLTAPNRNGVNLYALCTALVCAIQQIQKDASSTIAGLRAEKEREIHDLKQTLDTLEERIAKLESKD